jgi:chromosome segregation ATPase
MIPYGLYIKIGLVATLVLVLSFFYIDYKRLQGKAIDLSKQVENFQSEIMIQQEQIHTLQNSFEKQKTVRQELNKEIKIVTREIDSLQKKVLEHDVAFLASKKPILIQNAINNGTAEMVRCMELATGAEAKANEKNKTCPSLIINK